MQRSRRKKIIRFLLFFTLLLFILAYIFRYPLILQLQYTRLRSLEENVFDKVWVHRVNSLERYDLLQHKFKGFETDVSFNEATDALDVRHQPETSIGDTLTLEKFFQHVDLHTKHFWLDMRLRSTSNMNSALQALNNLDDKYHVRNACIVELYSAKAASLFAKNGYTVSLNLTLELQQKLLADPVMKDSIDRQLAQVKYISRDARGLSPVKKLFPKKQLITWHVLFSDFVNRQPVRDLLKDPQIDIILVNIKTPFYR
jgi:hypothetical protein